MFFKKFAWFFLFFVFFGGLVFAGPPVSSSTHPDSDKWYAGTSVSFEIGESGSGFSYEFDLSPDAVPDEVIDGADSTVSFNNRASGEQYFHVRVKNGGVWSDTSHFKVKIDDTNPLPPKSPKAIVGSDGLSIVLSWEEATDVQSGIGRYKIYRAFLRDFDIREPFVEVVTENAVGTEYVDDGLSEGKVYHYRVQAIDAVGNVGGVTHSFSAKIPTNCDFDPVISTELDGGDLLISIDSNPFLMRFASLTLKPEFGGDIEVFKGQSNTDLFEESVDVSNLSDQKILIDFDVQDESNDTCDTEETFFLDRVSPVGQWVFPSSGGVLIENVSLEVNATDGGENPSGISRVEFFYDDGGLQKIGEVSEPDSENVVFDFDSLTIPNGRFDLVAMVFDNAGNFVEKKVNVFVKNTAVISGQANDAIMVAEEKKLAAMELQSSLDSLGVVSDSFSLLFESADANLLRAKDVFLAGVNFERAITDAQSASALFDEAVSSVLVEKTGSFIFVFPEENIVLGFEKVGLKGDLVSLAHENIGFFSPVRRAEVFKVVDGNRIFFKLAIVLTFSRPENFDENVQLVEVVPKALASGSSDFFSDSVFVVLNSGPVIKFDVDLNASNKITYSFAKTFSESEAAGFEESNPLELFESVPIVLGSSVLVDSQTVVRPLDFFELIDFVAGEQDYFSIALAGLGVFVVLVLVLGIFSFFIVFLAVLKSS